MKKKKNLFFSTIAVTLLLSANMVAHAEAIKYRDGSVDVIGGQDPTMKRLGKIGEGSDDFFDLESYVRETIKAARPVYNDLGRPRVVLYMNKVFTERVSDYMVGARLKQDSSFENTGVMVGTKNDHIARMHSSTSIESRQQQELPYVRPAQIFTSKFKAGVSQILRKIPVKQIDQTAIKRLAASKKEPSSMTLNEMKGLQKYADYIAEFLFVNDGEAVSGFSIEMRLIRINDGLLVGMDIFEPEAIGETEEYEITEQGFEMARYLEVPTGKGIGEGAGATLLNLFVDNKEIL